MSYELESLEPRIREILSAPGTDLNTISAKRVRKQLLELNPSITEEFVKVNKEQIDHLIASVFESVNNANGSTEPPEHTSGKRKREDDVLEDEAEEDGEDEDGGEEYGSPGIKAPPPKAKVAKGKAKKGEMTDEEYARLLSSELNGRSSRTSRSGKPNGKSKKGASRTPKKTKKSAEHIADSDQESGSGSDDGKKRKKKRKSAAGEGGGGAKGGFSKEFNLSGPLSTVLQKDRLSRPQVVKQLWDYIKANELQNPSDRREIVCDDALRAVFSVDKISMFKMNKVLGQHLLDEE